MLWKHRLLPSIYLRRKGRLYVHLTYLAVSSHIASWDLTRQHGPRHLEGGADFGGWHCRPHFLYHRRTQWKKVKVDEAAKGTGDLCGSSFVNRVFRKWFTNRFYDLEGYGEDALEAAMEHFHRSGPWRIDCCQGAEDRTLSMASTTSTRLIGYSKR